jgi:hypothetical protein
MFEKFRVPDAPKYCSTLKKLLADKKFADLTLQVDGQSLKVHSIILEGKLNIISDNFQVDL